LAASFGHLHKESIIVAASSLAVVLFIESNLCFDTQAPLSPYLERTRVGCGVKRNVPRVVARFLAGLEHGAESALLLCDQGLVGREGGVE
jgi:hypothetical protein